jgi:UDP-GlcNAc:undecaprenyl-phosphate GlcNAc-1-phosphate transferase
MVFVLAFLIAFALAVAATPLAAVFARKVGAVDAPDGGRKQHGRPVPLMGGLAIGIALLASSGIALSMGWLPGDHIRAKYVIGLGIALTLLAIGGALDDKLNLSPRTQIIWPFLAVLIVIASGIGVSFITNPLGGIIHLDPIVTTVLWWDGIPYRLTLLADLFTVAWLMGMTYTTKFLDGIDGLVSGITVIGALVIGAVSVMQEVAQPDTALLALMVAGAFAGFLLFNAFPARVFLGEGGSTMAGFLLGTLAIISGGKIATTLLILGLPILDAAVVLIRRVLSGKSPTTADRSHLHFKLLDIGLTQRQTVLFFWLIAALFGVSTLVLRGPEKLAALGVLVAVLAIISLVAIVAYRRRK